MELVLALTEMQAFGTEQNRKISQRHGVREDLFGVSYAHLKTLKQRIKTDQQLAESLWATGNHDARVLATMIADPKAISRETLDAWSAALGNYVISDALAGVAAASPHALEVVEAWTHSDEEWVAAAGWSTLAHRVTHGEPVDEASLRDWLLAIEATIHTAKNRVRYAMNGAIIAIGGCSPKMQELAIAAAQRIGKVDVDHGETGCKTPDAVAYIQKMSERAQSKSR